MQKLRQEVEKGKIILSSAQQVRLEIDALFDGADFSETLTRSKFEDLNIDLFRETIKPVEQVLIDAHLNPEDIDQVVLVGGSTRIPKVQQLLTEFLKGKELSRDINPDEAVAYGAAVNGAILSGKVESQDLILQDITPLTLSTEVIGEIAHNMIPRNTAIPVKVSKDFTTTSDGQTVIVVRVCKGERKMFQDNHFLGSFLLTGIQPAPRGVPRILTTFQIDANGILTVNSEDRGTGNKNQITIQTNMNYLSTNDIERMVSEAEVYAEEDKQILEKAIARNKLESFTYSVRNKIKNNGQLSQMVSDTNRIKITQAVQSVNSWMESNQNATVDDYMKRMKDLEDLLSLVTEQHKVIDEL